MKQKDSYTELWEKNVGPIATEIDEALHEIMARHPDLTSQGAAIIMGAYAVEAGHILQQMEAYFGYTENYRETFKQLMEQSFLRCKAHPDSTVLESPRIAFDDDEQAN